MSELPEGVLDDLTLVYLCNPEWCDDGFHVEDPEPFEAFLFKGDVEEFSSDWCHCFPLSEGEIITAYRMPCRTWFKSKPERMTVLQAKEKLTSSSW